MRACFGSIPRAAIFLQSEVVFWQKVRPILRVLNNVVAQTEKEHRAEWNSTGISAFQKINRFYLTARRYRVLSYFCGQVATV